MAEVNASLGYVDFISRVSELVGYGYNYSLLTAPRLAEVERYVQQGWRRVFFPPPLPGERKPHVWRWRKPTMSMTLWADVAVDAQKTLTAWRGSAIPGGGAYVTLTRNTRPAFNQTQVGAIVNLLAYGDFIIYDVDGAGVATIYDFSASGGPITSGSSTPYAIIMDGDYSLPDDFGGLIGPITFADASGRGKINPTNEARIRQRRVENDATGTPVLAAYRYRRTDYPGGTPTASASARQELLVWPVPDRDYDVQFIYRLLPIKLSAAYAYPPGGVSLSEVVLESCLAAVELAVDEAPGVHEAEFQRQLVIAVGEDRHNSPETFGIMRDDSDDLDDGRGTRNQHTGLHYVTYNGQYGS